ncbi:hypothetical protein BCV70DRAFT_32252 [Testicularia cyperi]|uniref:Uncharacterized protein n=1 Tax=Testicularia cyperi TaxID=1882483 RepID=A0A317XMA1_9BASI|nr:hypothetical protein BCV70DRAFT_32252 [Testicularia cyperi]
MILFGEWVFLFLFYFLVYFLLVVVNKRGANVDTRFHNRASERASERASLLLRYNVLACCCSLKKRRPGSAVLGVYGCGRRVGAPMRHHMHQRNRSIRACLWSFVRTRPSRESRARRERERDREIDREESPCLLRTDATHRSLGFAHNQTANYN